MSDFARVVSRCDFLFDWQKERLMALLDDAADGNGHICARDVFPVLDNVLWRTVGVSLDSLPVGDRLAVERAVREVV